MRLFISYTRQDQPKVHPLANGLRLLRHEVWLDQEISGGQAWWDTILNQIRDCDAMLLALSPGALRSQACEQEREYAAALGKPILPVMVERVLPDVLPPEVAIIQVVDYTTSDQEAVFRLAGALSTLPPTPPLPNPLPMPPAVPVSYLSDLSHRIQAPTLTMDEQLALTARLKTALEDTQQRDAAVFLLHELQQRQDLYYAAAKELENLAAFSSGELKSRSHPDEGQSTPPRTWLVPPTDATKWRAKLVDDSRSSRTFSIALSEEQHAVTLRAAPANLYFVTLVDGKVIKRDDFETYAKKGLEFVLTDGDQQRTAKLLLVTTSAAEYAKAALGGFTFGAYRKVGRVRLSVDNKVLYEG